MEMEAVKLTGRVLFMSEDPSLVRRQIQGEDLPLASALPLREHVCEDEIVPGWVSFYFYQRLGDFPYLGLLCGGGFPISEGAVRRGGFQVAVFGQDYGLPGPMEVAPFAESAAGLRLIIADSFHPTYLRNCHAVGLLTSTDLGLVERIRRGEALAMETFTAGLDSLAAEVVRTGGSFAYTQARLQGQARLPLPVSAPRAMTLAEKIIARAALSDLASQTQGLVSVAPGDGVLVKADWRVSHESATLLAATMLKQRLGEQVPFHDPGHILAFRDHLAFKEHFQAHDQRQPGLLSAVQRMEAQTLEFCQARAIHLHGETPEGVSEGISHLLMTDRYVQPGQVVVGTDTHTCHCGALGALAFGVGAADIANAWITGDVRLTVAPSCLVRLNGQLPAGVCAKDLALHLLTLPPLREGRVKGQMLEFQGSALAGLGTDERSTLTNMAANLGALAGLCAPDQETVRFLRERRGLELVLEPWMHSDAEAQFGTVLEVDCDAIGPMLAAPGHPGNGIPLESLGREVAVDLAYVGSCTGGKREDLERVYEVVKWALEHQLKLPLQVQFFIQLGSEDVRRHALRMGWLELFEQAGARVVHPGCGACINAGPGVSTRADQVTISAVNRNFPGRSGPGQVWLASPATVAASAFCGRICGFEQLRRN